jgi:subtilisin family serine protease
MYLLLSLFVALAFAKAPLFTYEDTIEGQYIVIYHPHTADELQLKHQSVLGQNVFATYNITTNFMGYAAHLTKEEVEIIRDDPIVAEVHPDTNVYLYRPQQDCDTTQNNARSWGICRLSQWGAATAGSSSTYKWHSGSAGQGVNVYVVDTGIKLTHQEFEGRAVWGANYVDNIRDDNNGHGTHCAGTIGGSSVGMARYSRLVAVRVLNGQGSGTNSGVISGINYAATQHRNQGVPSVVSMSLGGGYNAAMNNAVTSCISAGVTCVVAAGNDNANACNYSPASTPNAITVGSTTTDASNRDVRSSFSNYGNCVDIFAPGSNIYSCGITSNTAYTTLSGTSMACPHVAGLAANVLHERGHLSPAAVKSAVINDGNWDHITNPNTPNNVIAYNGC